MSHLFFDHKFFPPTVIIDSANNKWCIIAPDLWNDNNMSLNIELLDKEPILTAHNLVE